MYCSGIHMRYVERKLQQIMEELEKYLRNIPMDENVWDDIIALEKKLEYHVEAAYLPQDFSAVHYYNETDSTPLQIQSRSVQEEIH